MNRRSFLSKSALALFGFSILPSAGRIWKAQAPVSICSEYVIGIQPTPHTDRIIFLRELYRLNPDTGLMERVGELEPIQFEPHSLLEITQPGGTIGHWKHYKV